jgi:tetratricopeptide (TPR) repeat protein
MDNPNNQLAADVHTQGLTAFDKGDVKLAKDLLEHSIQLDPSCAYFYANLANVLQQMGLLQQAQQMCWLAIERDPASAESYYCLGVIFDQEGEHEVALQHFLSASNIIETGLDEAPDEDNKLTTSNSVSSFLQTNTFESQDQVGSRVTSVRYPTQMPVDVPIAIDSYSSEFPILVYTAISQQLCILDRVSDALPYFEAIAAMEETTGNTDIAEQGWIFSYYYYIHDNNKT